MTWSERGCQGRFTLNPQYWRGLQGDDVGQFLFIPRKP